MTDKDILNLAGKYAPPESREEQCFYDDGTPSREVHVMTHWDFCTEELLAFAKDLISQVRGL